MHFQLFQEELYFQEPSVQLKFVCSLSSSPSPPTLGPSNRHQRTFKVILFPSYHLHQHTTLILPKQQKREKPQKMSKISHSKHPLNLCEIINNRLSEAWVWWRWCLVGWFLTSKSQKQASCVKQDLNHHTCNTQFYLLTRTTLRILSASPSIPW